MTIRDTRGRDRRGVRPALARARARGARDGGAARAAASVERPWGSSSWPTSRYALPGGWTLFEGVSFRVPEGEHGLVGANGIGKSTLLRLIVGDDRPTAGSIQTDGRVGLMRQFIGSEARPTTVRDFLLAYAEPRVAGADPRRQGRALDARSPGRGGADAVRRRARELGRGRRLRGRGAVRPVHARGVRAGLPECAERKIETLSGGERKRRSR